MPNRQDELTAMLRELRLPTMATSCSQIALKASKENLAYDNDSIIFGPFVLFVHLLLLKCPLPLRRASFDEPRSSCASSSVSSCALLVLLVPPVSLAAFSLE